MVVTIAIRFAQITLFSKIKNKQTKEEHKHK